MVSWVKKLGRFRNFAVVSDLGANSVNSDALPIKHLRGGRKGSKGNCPHAVNAKRNQRNTLTFLLSNELRGINLLARPPPLSEREVTIGKEKV